jgi:transposase
MSGDIGPNHFRHRIAQLRPRREAEAYLRPRTLPGDQSQFDWAHFGHPTDPCRDRFLIRRS